MNFNPFSGYGPFGCHSTNNPHSFKDLAEDVPFVEVDETSKKPQIDKNARAEQIAKEAEEKTSELLDKSPVAALHVIIMFSAGAQWADEHPESDFNNRAERISSLRAEVDSMLKGASGSNERNYMFEALSYALFADGAQWADNHPAPTL